MAALLAAAGGVKNITDREQGRTENRKPRK